MGGNGETENVSATERPQTITNRSRITNKFNQITNHHLRIQKNQLHSKTDPPPRPNPSAKQTPQNDINIFWGKTEKQKLSPRKRREGRDLLKQRGEEKQNKGQIDIEPNNLGLGESRLPFFPLARLPVALHLFLSLLSLLSGEITFCFPNFLVFFREKWTAAGISAALCLVFWE